jgi:very-short-patch-repair endonuclease
MTPNDQRFSGSKTYRQTLTEQARGFRKNATPTETILWHALRGRQWMGTKFRRQHPIGRSIVDFYAAELHLAIEIDGPVHLHQPEEDQARQQDLEARGITVLRFTTEQIENDLEAVLEKIATFKTPHP